MKSERPQVGADRDARLSPLRHSHRQSRRPARNSLHDAGISTVLNYPKALPFYPAYAYLGHTPEDFPVAYANQSRILSLPIYPEMTDEMIAYVAGKITDFFGK